VESFNPFPKLKGARSGKGEPPRRTPSCAPLTTCSTPVAPAVPCVAAMRHAPRWCRLPPARPVHLARLPGVGPLRAAPHADEFDRHTRQVPLAAVLVATVHCPRPPPALSPLTCEPAASLSSPPLPRSPPSLWEKESAGLPLPPRACPVFTLPLRMALTPPRRSRLVRLFPTLMSLPVPLLMLP
jgi:hypothetical protein